MKAAPVRYYRPDTLEQAVDVLRSEPGGAQLLAGGQSLMPALALHECAATTLVDISALAELRGVRRDDDDTVVVQAAEPLRSLEHASSLHAAIPLLHQAIATVGAMAIRSRCSLGGSLAWGDPSSQLPAAMAASRAVITTTQRTEPAATFVQKPPLQRLAPAEVIVSITIPAAHRAGAGLAQVRRTHITWPTAGAATLIDDAGTSLALFGAGPTHVATHADSDEGAIAQATALITDLDDGRAGVDYRRSVLPVLARRAVTQARRERDGAR